MHRFKMTMLSALAALPLGLCALGTTAQAQGGALLFDGVDDLCTVLDTNDDFDLGASMTIEAWVRVDSPGSIQGIALAGISGLFTSGNSPGMVVSVPTTNSAISPGTAPTGVWTHLAGTYDGSTIQIFVNGVLEQTTAQPGSANLTTELLLGRFAANGFFAGALDEVRVWNVVRTDAEIAAHYDIPLTGAPASLVGYYKFDGVGSALLDSSGAGNHGHLGATSAVEASDPARISSGVMFCQAGAGNALLFDGAGDFCRALDTDDHFDLGTSMTIEAWVRVDSPEPFAGIALVGTTGLFAFDNSAGMGASAPSPVLAQASGTSLPNGVWAHLAGTYDGSTVQIFVNGVLEQATPNPGSLTPALDLVLGRFVGAGHFAGALDEVRVWNVVRTDEEIAHFSALPLSGVHAGLVACYSFDEAGGQMILDSSGFGNHGFLGGDASLLRDPARIASDVRACADTSNDDCANAIDVSSGGQFLGSLVGATSDGTATCGSSTLSPDIWYSYSATEVGELTVSTSGTNDLYGEDTGVDTVLSVHDGCGGSQLACNDDAPLGTTLDLGQAFDSAVIVPVLPGDTILIRVANFSSGQVGPIVLNVSFEGGFRDLCNGDGGDQMGCANCPCGNEAAPGTIGGCLNSASTAARLVASGDTSVSLPTGSSSDLRFAISGAPAGAFCILNSGDGVAPGGMANPCFGMSSGIQAMQFDGLRCAIMNTRRHGGRSADGNGDVGVTNNPWGGEGGPPVGIAVAGGGFAAGQTRFFQVINRDDPLASCTRGLNTSQAIGVTFAP